MGVSTHKESSSSNSCLNTKKSVIKLAMLPVTFQIWNTALPSPSVREGYDPRMRVVSTSNSPRGQSRTRPGANSHPSATNDIPAPSHPLTTQQRGAVPQQQLRSADTANSAIHGQIQFSPASLTHPKASRLGNATSHDHIRGHQPPVSPTVSRPMMTEDRTHSGLERDGGSGGHFPLSSCHPPIINNMASSGRRLTNNPPGASHKRCLLPHCPYSTYYDFSEQEQAEYCGPGHELQAVANDLVSPCVMCKGRPRRTGERVCGRTCRERELQARQAQGSTPLATNSPPNSSPKRCRCRIPNCTYNAYYDLSEQEQTEYCGQGHELQAVSTGLVASCMMCKVRPRRMGERVCGRTCRERERQARPVQGLYYGVSVVRREP